MASAAPESFDVEKVRNEVSKISNYARADRRERIIGVIWENEWSYIRDNKWYDFA